jgi:tripeptide aminopeptidase
MLKVFILFIILCMSFSMTDIASAQILPNETAVQRFIRYVQVNTQSDHDTTTVPSSEGQFKLGTMLADELRALGLQDIHIDQYGFVTATLPSSLPADFPGKERVPVVGLFAHMDTSPDVSGEQVKPVIHRNYRGGDIVLPGDPSQVIREHENPALKSAIGSDIITSDGTTLLGADDKAGIAAIMTALQTLVRNPEMYRHGDIRIAFTIDEEIGTGISYFDLERFDADVAYTIDGGTTGEISNETFNAKTAILRITGRDIHPGYAKDIMINSIRIVADFISRLPKDISPEMTADREGYIHPNILTGSTLQSEVRMLLRDFEMEGIEEKETILHEIIDELREVYPGAEIDLEIQESYRNMRYWLDNEPRVTEYAVEAIRRAGLEPNLKPIRGGTDGARLTERGLPTPNIFTGGENFHSRQEWLSVTGLNKSVETILHLLNVWVEKSVE